jgi:membrane-bound lytic murein transglycosylase D
MEPYTLRIPAILAFGIFILFFNFSLQAKGDYPEYDEEQIIERLEAIEDPLLEYRFNSIVRGYLKGYLYWNRRKAELVTGRAVMYYPMIEQYLKEYNLPEKLKYLPVVESALNPHAVSPVGAVGLWQFMPGTALDHGLKINKLVDERKDPHKSTQAALSYLDREYKKYGSWALALAAYNGGSGRVSRAIKRGRSKNFWKIRRYLPRETRNYVPAYIAATYLMEYYKEHEVEPEYPSLELQISEYTKVYHTVSFHRIAQVTGLSLDVIELLNPAYKRKIIPENSEGNYLILPSRVMPDFKAYLESLRPDQTEEPYFDDTPVKVNQEAAEVEAENYVKAYYHVGKEESLSEVAKFLKCTVHQLVAWNKLKSEQLQAGQELVFYQPKDLIRIPVVEPMEVPPTLETAGLVSSLEPMSAEPSAPLRDYVVYIVTTRENLSRLADRLPGVSFPMLLDYNQLSKDRKVTPGERIKVPIPVE